MEVGKSTEFDAKSADCVEHMQPLIVVFSLSPVYLPFSLSLSPSLPSLQKEKRQELDRRQQSKNLGQFRQMQEDRRNQSWIEERRKEQLEAKRAREEVKAKLEQDRLERLAQKQQRATETAGGYV